MRTKAQRSHGRPEKERLIRAVAAARAEWGLSQRKLSERLGLHPLTIARFERGERMLDVLELLDIAAALETDPVLLLKACLEEEAPSSSSESSV